MRKDVTKKAVIQRINRRLKKDWEAVKGTRGEKNRPELGDYYLLDVWNGTIIDKRIDIEGFARELNVLAECESVDVCSERYAEAGE